MCFRVLPDKSSIECLVWWPFVLHFGAKHLTAFQTKHANCFIRLPSDFCKYKYKYKYKHKYKHKHKCKHLAAYWNKHANCLTCLLQQISAKTFETVYFHWQFTFIGRNKTALCSTVYPSASKTFLQRLFLLDFLSNHTLTSFWLAMAMFPKGPSIVCKMFWFVYLS